MDNDPFVERLLKSEKILWSGRPRQGIVLRLHDVFLIPFSLIWGGFAIFWETTVLQSKAPSLFALVGLPFVLVGLFLIFGRFLLDAWLRTKLVYALTNQRVLIARAGPWSIFNALNLDRLPETSLSEGSNGRGTIRFGQQGLFSARGGAGFGIGITALDSTPQFLDIEDARRVFDLVQERTQAVSR
jgi:hypothetical protein